MEFHRSGGGNNLWSNAPSQILGAGRILSLLLPTIVANGGYRGCRAVLDFLNHDCFDDSINAIYIVLIPKKNNPTRITEYRPISFCNVLYKLIAKVLANQLKQALAKIISPTQSTFVPGRLISNNDLVAFKDLHTMDVKMKGWQGYMTMKLYISKAYDKEK